MEEKNITQWMHLEPLEKVPISIPKRIPISIPEKVPTPLSHNKKKPENEENETENEENTRIWNLYIQINSLKSENIKLRK